MLLTNMTDDEYFSRMAQLLAAERPFGLAKTVGEWNAASGLVVFLGACEIAKVSLSMSACRSNCDMYYSGVYRAGFIPQSYGLLARSFDLK